MPANRTTISGRAARAAGISTRRAKIELIRPAKRRRELVGVPSGTPAPTSATCAIAVMLRGCANWSGPKPIDYAQLLKSETQPEHCLSARTSSPLEGHDLFTKVSQSISQALPRLLAHISS